MQVRIESIRLGVAVAAALLAGASVVSAQENTQAPAPAAAPAASACTLTLDPQSLKPQADPLQVKATLSQSIGDAVAAEIQEPNSGIDVSLVPAMSAGRAGPSAQAPKKRGSKPAAGAQTAPAPAADASASGQVVNLRLTTGAAKAGDYTLALKGATGSCSGKITLEGADAPAAAPAPTKP